jgi:hypothetical protein
MSGDRVSVQIAIHMNIVLYGVYKLDGARSFRIFLLF